VLPGLTEPQQRVLDAGLRYWIKTTAAPRTADTLLGFLTDRLDDLRHWDELSEAEAGALNVRSAAVVAIRLRRLINESKSFYCTGMDQPLDVKAMVGPSIEEAFGDPAHVRSVIENDVPLLAADWGAKDEGALIHSLGLHLLASLGRAVGYVGRPSFRFPAPGSGRKRRCESTVHGATATRG
jgi:hypothetical protein